MEGEKQEDRGLTFARNEEKLIDNYTNKVALQKKYCTATGINSMNSDNSTDGFDHLTPVNPRPDHYSEFDHMNKQVKARNLIEMFYEQ